MRVFAWVGFGLGIFILLALAIYLFIGWLIFSHTFARKKNGGRAFKKNIDKKIKDFHVDLCWWDKVKFERVEMINREKMKLVGHFLNNNSKKTAIIVHGYGGSYVEMQPYCRFFAERGFNVLAVDNRAHGESEGQCLGFGWYDRLDVCDWIDFVNRILDEQKIVLFGLSMGATAVCCAAGEKLPQNVVGIISDCAFANGKKQLVFSAKKKMPFSAVFVNFFARFLRRIQDFDLDKVDAVKALRTCSVPILLIHGDCDEVVPIENMFDLFGAVQSGLCQTYVVSGAGHALSYATAGILYENKINSFLRNNTKINSLG